MEKILALIAVSFGKKATVYAIGRTYGFPRLYRRFIEFNKKITSNRDALRNRKTICKSAFRFPNRIVDFLRRRKEPAVG
eukprot:gene10877-12031_t